MRSLGTLFLLGTLACLSFAASPAEWRSRSIYFIMTDRFARTDGSTTAPCDVSQGKYCGGTWRGIINKLDYIKGMGFTAIWITPVTQNIETKEGTEAYHGYWQNNLYKVNQHLGTEADLKALASALHARGMYLMVDVVANHFGAEQPTDAVDYSLLTPFNDKSYFHTPCNPDYSNQTSTEICWLAYGQHVNLPDVNTTQSRVRTTYQKWIANLVKTYSVDGLRVDTVKHVEKPFWPGFNKASGVYNVGEVFIDDVKYLCDYQNYMDGLLNYILYYPLTAAFQSESGNMTDLANQVNQIKTTCKDSTLLGPFLENHDNPRFPSITPDIALAKNAITYVLLADGVPIIYYGQEQHFNGANDPYDREALWLSGYNTNAELYKSIASVNKFRNYIVGADRGFLTYKMSAIYTDAHTIAMRKGNVISIYTNQGSSGKPYRVTLTNTGYGSNVEVIDILSCKKTRTNYGGGFAVTLSKGQPAIFYPTSKLGGGICGYNGGYYGR